MVFIQEALPGILADPPDGWVVVQGEATSRGSVGRSSALLVRVEVGRVSAPPSRGFPALGTYAAEAVLQIGDASLWLISAHTSPSPVPPHKRRPDFQVRSCESQPWWSDAFLADLRDFDTGRTIGAVIAGDFNQALAYDEANGHSCSREFLDAVRAAGFIDATSRDWDDVERATRRSPDYQLDRVLVSKSFADRVAVSRADIVHDDASDHAAITFEIDN